MPQMTTIEVFGFCDNLFKFMELNAETVEKTGISLDVWKTEVEAQKQAALARNAEQEAQKRLLTEKTKETEAALKAAYMNASSKLDALVGALGKTTPLARPAAKLRSEVLAAKRRPRKSA